MQFHFSGKKFDGVIRNSCIDQYENTRKALVYIAYTWSPEKAVCQPTDRLSSSHYDQSFALSHPRSSEEKSLAKVLGFLSHWDPLLKTMCRMPNMWHFGQALGILTRILRHLPQLQNLDLTIIDAVIDSTSETVFDSYLWELIGMTGLSSLKISCAMPDSDWEPLSLPTVWMDLQWCHLFLQLLPVCKDQCVCAEVCLATLNMTDVYDQYKWYEKLYTGCGTAALNVSTLFGLQLSEWS